MAHSIVIFGASGDLTKRKLIPALFRLFQKKKLPEQTRIIGVSRREYSDDQWRQMLAETTAEFLGDRFDAADFAEFAKSVHYLPGDINQAADFPELEKRLVQLEDGPADRIYYLSTSPSLYPVAIANLGTADMAIESHGKRRIVVEKPFGTDLGSAQALNDDVHRVFNEQQVYRIDHYLGKETVQNLMVLRFANSIFEPIWNRNYIDNVQITAAESVTVEGRGGYYDQSGILRDMFQNHILQLLMITAMEAPVRFDANMVRDEKVKVLQAVRPLAGGDFVSDTLRGQYQGYREAEGVPAKSETATFAAMKLYVDNWRWKGVPFFLRSGKAMSCRTTQIVIQFRRPPVMMFSASPEANKLVIQIQPAEGIQLHFQSKTPNAGMRPRNAELDFRFRQDAQGVLPDAYQRLLMDALVGDASLFARSDEVELAWEIIDPILAAWRSPAAPPLQPYDLGYWGPEASQDWIRGHGCEWFDVCPVLH
jgi:glucose-6-phosphate 1-dehydrogenase